MARVAKGVHKGTMQYKYIFRMLVIALDDQV